VRKFARAQGELAAGVHVVPMQNNTVPMTGMTVDDVMRRWPSTIRVFLDFRMRCVGCPIAAFHSVDEACVEHDVDVGAFLPRIVEAAKAAA
jgi:hybrid cluster-associated redox disulfide protein